MAANSRFAMGVHALALLAADPEKTFTSETIAAGIDTNPVVVRRILSLLQQAGLVSSQKGPTGGSRLKESPKKINLATIYRAIEKRPVLPFPYGFANVKDANQKKTAASVKETFDEAEKAVSAEMERITLAQIVKKTQRVKK